VAFFRETFAQHYAGLGGSYIESEHTLLVNDSLAWCSRKIWTFVPDATWLNDAARTALRRANLSEAVQMLDVWKWSSVRPRGHYAPYDCTHYCRSYQFFLPLWGQLHRTLAGRLGS
jgi:hypothetical protein